MRLNLRLLISTVCLLSVSGCTTTLTDDFLCVADHPYMETLDEPPRKLDDLPARFTGARDFTYYALKLESRTPICFDGTAAYYVRFRVDDSWLLAAFDKRGNLHSTFDWSANCRPSCTFATLHEAAQHRPRCVHEGLSDGSRSPCG